MATIKFSLWDFLGAIPDPRSSSGRRFSLQSVLGVIIAGTLAGKNSIRSIARWAEKLTPKDLQLLNIKRNKAPTQTTMHEILCRLDPEHIEHAFSSWISNFTKDDKSLHIAIDGKTLRGSATDEYPALHLISAYCVDISAVLSQIQVSKNENEFSAAKRMLFDMPLNGKIITGDAIFCQHELCNIILKNKGDYIFVVKQNQKQLLNDIKSVFKKHSFPLYTQAKYDDRVRKI
jgi:hypothetical protein